MKLPKVIERCLKRMRRWQCPLHWTWDDWKEELVSAAWLAYLEGKRDGIASDEAMERHIMAALMRRYRDEWNYGVRWITPSPSEDTKEGEKTPLWDSPTDGYDQNEEWETYWKQMVVRQALRYLSKEDRYLIIRRFWDGATEKELAKELGVSQPAVHKRLKRVLNYLKSLLETL